jgi:hypothetical protein
LASADDVPGVSNNSADDAQVPLEFWLRFGDAINSGVPAEPPLGFVLGGAGGAEQVRFNGRHCGSKRVRVYHALRFVLVDAYQAGPAQIGRQVIRCRRMFSAQEGEFMR